MTIAISLKINDGLVLAADSASTVTQMIPDQQAIGVVNVYNNANKVFNLYKGLPIGAITWGGGSIGRASIETLVKDLRARFSSESPKYAPFRVNPKEYTVKEIASKFRKFVYEELYLASFPLESSVNRPEIGFIVAGYSTDGDLAEEYNVVIKADGSCDEPTLLRPIEDVGVTWAGQSDALNRLITGYSAGLPAVLANKLGVPADQLPIVLAIIRQALQAQMIVAPMPLQDAIDLAEFMVQATINFARFTPGPPTVGGPIEIAAISKHEGFRWVQRKHYYHNDLNRTEIHNAHSNS